MRPRLSKEDLVLVLEGLTYLFRYHSRKKDQHETRRVYLLFDNLSTHGLGRRRSWMWNDDELISKRRKYYQDMLKRIKEIKESESETEPQTV